MIFIRPVLWCVVLLFIFGKASANTKPRILKPSDITPDGSRNLHITEAGTLQIRNGNRTIKETLPMDNPFIRSVVRSVAFLPNNPNAFLFRDEILSARDQDKGDRSSFYYMGSSATGNAHIIPVDPVGFQSEYDFFTHEQFTADGKVVAILARGPRIGLVHADFHLKIADLLFAEDTEEDIEEYQNTFSEEPLEPIERENLAFVTAEDLRELLSPRLRRKLMVKLRKDPDAQKAFRDQTEIAGKIPGGVEDAIVDGLEFSEYLGRLVTNLRFINDDRAVEITFRTGDKVTWTPRILACRATLEAELAQDEEKAEEPEAPGSPTPEE